jgi:polyferredoxin
MHLSSGWEEISASPGGFVVLFILVIGVGLLIERFWCRYLCPLGAALGILQKFSLTKVAREEDTCISCGKCNRSCPMGLDPMSVDRVTSADCISCGRCVEECPVPGTLRFSTVGGWAMSALSVGLLGVTLYFAGYGASRLAGYWQTFPPTPTVSTSTAASPTGVPRNPDELKGSFSLAEIASGYGLELSSILEKAGWPADTDPDIKMREAADALGREASDIRNAVKELLKGP